MVASTALDRGRQPPALAISTNDADIMRARWVVMVGTVGQKTPDTDCAVYAVNEDIPIELATKKGPFQETGVLAVAAHGTCPGSQSLLSKHS
jgi:hypothetical protein